MYNTESAEMYLEAILLLTQKQGAPRAIDVVHHTGYSKPSVSRAMGLLKKKEYISIDVNGYIMLTDPGKEVATKILERHRVLTDFLIQLGVDEATAAEDACRIEHIISDVSFGKLKAHLGKK